MPGQREFVLQALPLPISILALGTAASYATHVWLRSPGASIEDFQTDAASLAKQVASRVKRDVNERFAARFMEWGADEITLETWRRFTDDDRSSSPESVIQWTPRIRDMKTSRFEQLARQAFPDVETTISVKRAVAPGKLVPNGDVTTSTRDEDLWPVLYSNPLSMDFIGYDVASLPLQRDAIEHMLETNDTAVTEAIIAADTGLVGFVVFHPVFASPSDPSSGVVGSITKSLRIQDLLVDILDTMKFPRRYPGAHVAVFLRVGDIDEVVPGAGGGGGNDQLLFDLDTCPSHASENSYHHALVTPEEVLRLGGEHFSQTASLTPDKAILVVCSFEPDTNSQASIWALGIGFLVSLVVSSLLYSHQILVLVYKKGMETARGHSVLKMRFLAEMAHEIRTPLTGIVSAAEMLAEQKTSPDFTTLLDTVEACSRILMSLVNDALDFSKIEAAELHVEARAVCLRRVLHEAVDFMNRTYRSQSGVLVANVRLSLEMAKSVAATHVLADETRIRQVLVNLLSNAFKFTDAGSVTVTAYFDAAEGGAGKGETFEVIPQAKGCELTSCGSVATFSNGQCASRSTSAVAHSATAARAVADFRSTTSTASLAQRRSRVAPFVSPIRRGAGQGRSRNDGSSEASSVRRSDHRAKQPVLSTAILSWKSALKSVRSWRLARWCRQDRIGHGKSRGIHGRGRGGSRSEGTTSYIKSLNARTHEIVMLVVEVADTGVGMTPEQTGRLFKPFSQVHHGSGREVGGTGLGLAISKSLCESMGGTLTCKSHPAAGTTFRFSVLVGVPRRTSTPPDRGGVSEASRRPSFSTCIAHEWDLAEVQGSKCMMKDAAATERNRKTGKLTQRESALAAPLGCAAESTSWTRTEEGDAQRDEVEFLRGCQTSLGPGSASPEQLASDTCRSRASRSVVTVDASVVNADGDSSKGGGEGGDGSDCGFPRDAQATGETKEAGGPRPHGRPSDSHVRAKRPRVLVVDDFRMNRAMVCKMLEALDCDLETAEDGAQALEACRKSRFSLILMDVIMPVMDGIEATRAIRSGEKDDCGNRCTPIIALTARTAADGTGEDADAEYAAGITDLLPKPVTRTSLFTVVAKWASEAEKAWMRDAWLRYSTERKTVQCRWDVYLTGDEVKS